MEHQDKEEKIRYLKEEVGADISHFHGNYYRAAAYVKGGTYLACVTFRNPRYDIESVTGLLERARAGEYTVNGSAELAYRSEIVSLVSHGNRVNFYDIERIVPSHFAFPPQILSQIGGETTMGWTGFSAKMSDGKYFGFGTTHHFDFFEMPDSYRKTDIREIINHSYVLKTGELRYHQRAFFTAPPDYADAVVYQSLPFFECFVDEL
jgi:hypothetical protein